MDNQKQQEQISRIVEEMSKAVEKATAPGDSSQELIPFVYGELRRLAAYRLAQEKPGQTLQPTALVHEAYLRLVKDPDVHWESERHFFVAAGEAMRRILIEHARRKHRQRHGGEWQRSNMDLAEISGNSPTDEMLEIHEVLDQFEQVDPKGAELVKLRFFAGLTQQQCADLLGVSKRTADKLWAFARAWLYHAISENKR